MGIFYLESTGAYQTEGHGREPHWSNHGGSLRILDPVRTGEKPSRASEFYITWHCMLRERRIILFWDVASLVQGIEHLGQRFANRMG